MGTKRVANLFDKWLGTNSQIVLELAECPVWVIPQNAPLNYPKNFMYTADFKRYNILVTHKILEIAKPLAATCRVIHIHDYYELISNQTLKEKITELKHEFEDEADITIKNLNREHIYKGLKTYVKNFINPMFLR